MHNLKSKSGCLTCLSRRKKCDEARPVCRNCQRLGITCVGRDSHTPAAISPTNLKAKLPPSLHEVLAKHRYPSTNSRALPPVSAQSPGRIASRLEQCAPSAYIDVNTMGTPATTFVDTDISVVELMASERVFDSPKLLVHIILGVLSCSSDCPDEDVRSPVWAGQARARGMADILKCSRVSRRWQRAVASSRELQESMFLSSAPRSVNADPRRGDLNLFAADLNPILVKVFPHYNMATIRRCNGRCWKQQSSGVGETAVCQGTVVRLVIPKSHMPALSLRRMTHQGMIFSQMLLTQPPCTVLDVYNSVPPLNSNDTGQIPHDAVHGLGATYEHGVTLHDVHDKAQAIFDMFSSLDQIVFRLAFA